MQCTFIHLPSQETVVLEPSHCGVLLYCHISTASPTADYTNLYEHIPPMLKMSTFCYAGYR